MKQGRVTMDDISKACGLSKMTVSRVLAGRGIVSAKTKAVVLQACARLDYEINTQARNLSSNRSDFLGIATPFKGLMGSPYFQEIILGFQLALKDSDYDYAIFDTEQDSFNDGFKLAKLYRQRKVDGLLIVAPHCDDHFLNTLANLSVPLVVIGESHAHPTICMLSCHDAQGIGLLCEHLAGLGHRRIAYAGGPGNLTSAIRRKTTFENFFRDKGWAVPGHYIHPGEYTMKSGRIAGLALLGAHPRPTAIIGANDLIAQGLMESARQLNLRIPEDVSIAGFDDLPTAVESYPPLTTINQPVRAMAQKGASLLHDALKSGTLPTGRIRMDVTLVIRESTGKPPAE